jgi:hypothetical protein
MALPPSIVPIGRCLVAIPAAATGALTPTDALLATPEVSLASTGVFLACAVTLTVAGTWVAAPFQFIFFDGFLIP